MNRITPVKSISWITHKEGKGKGEKTNRETRTKIQVEVFDTSYFEAIEFTAGSKVHFFLFPWIGFIREEVQRTTTISLWIPRCSYVSTIILSIVFVCVFFFIPTCMHFLRLLGIELVVSAPIGIPLQIREI